MKLLDEIRNMLTGTSDAIKRVQINPNFLMDKDTLKRLPTHILISIKEKINNELAKRKVYE